MSRLNFANPDDVKNCIKFDENSFPSKVSRPLLDDSITFRVLRVFTIGSVASLYVLAALTLYGAYYAIRFPSV